MAGIKVALTLAFVLLGIPLMTRFLPMATASFDDHQVEKLTQKSFQLPMLESSVSLTMANTWPQAIVWVGRTFWT